MNKVIGIVFGIVLCGAAFAEDGEKVRPAEGATNVVVGEQQSQVADKRTKAGDIGTTTELMGNMVKNVTEVIVTEISPFNHGTKCSDTDYKYDFKTKEIVEWCSDQFTCRPPTAEEESVVVCELAIEITVEQSEPDSSGSVAPVVYTGFLVTASGQHQDSALAEEVARAILDYKFEKQTTGFDLSDPNTEVDIQCSAPSFCYDQTVFEDGSLGEPEEWHNYRYSN